MAHPRLPNSPLLEVTAELRFHGDLALYTSWGKVQAELRKEFPRLLVPTGEPGGPPMLQPVRLSSLDDTHGVMLAINTVGYTCRVYPGFDVFLASVSRIVQTFSRHSPPVTPSRFGLRYANLLPPTFPGELREGQVHPCLRAIVSGVPSVGGEFPEPPVLVLVTGQGDLQARLSLLPPTAVVGVNQLQLHANPHGVLLDIDVWKTADLEQAGFTDFLDRAHDLIERMFFGLITDEYYRYLKGEA
ncbi:MAG TPA: TIGR04255 family protein [Anaeromyxobacter sp.]|nr:TIGR04255 family protein [Anaeromyxobacter sp.]